MITVVYGDVAPEAKEAFEFRSPASIPPFVNPSDINQYNLDVVNYGNPCEPYQTLLDGSMPVLEQDSVNAGIWSKNAPDDVDVSFNFASDQRAFATNGLSIKFDTDNNIYPLDMDIWFYRNNEIILTETATIVDAEYYHEGYIPNFDSISLIVRAMNIEGSLLKIRSLDFGKGTVFLPKEIESANLIQEIDLENRRLPTNVFDITLIGRSDHKFFERQKMDVMKNDELLNTVFVSSWERTNVKRFVAKAEDAISFLQDTDFGGGIYTNKSAQELFQEIFDKAGVDVDLDFTDENVNGWIPYGTCRDAAIQVAFATRCVIDTTGNEDVKIYRLDDTIVHDIPKSRVMINGISVKDSATVTAVDLTQHDFVQTEELAYGYNAEESGIAGNNVLVKFTEPLAELEVFHGTIIESSENYAIADLPQNDSQLFGKRYIHNQSIVRAENPNKLYNERENVVTLENATLVGAYNIDTVLAYWYNVVTRTRTVMAKVVERIRVEYDYNKSLYGENKYGSFKYAERERVEQYDPTIKCGERVRIDCGGFGVFDGYVIKTSARLTNGMIVKEVTIR